MKIRSRPLVPHLLLLLLALAAGVAQAGAPLTRAHRDVRAGAGVLRPAPRVDVGPRVAADLVIAVGFVPARAPVFAVAATVHGDAADSGRETIPARETARD